VENLDFKTYQHPLDNAASIETVSAETLKRLQGRRSIRKFSDKPVPRTVIENCLLAAGTAPSGANKQPWFFAVIESPDVKKSLRIAAEAEENLFYSQRASQKWLDDLKPFKTNAHKPYLDKAPYLIAVFSKIFEDAADPKSSKNYYPRESVGIATGLLIHALHNCGLGTLTHTPSPMNFLNEELGLCKKQYHPFLLLITGYAAKTAQVPVLSKKTLSETSKFY